MAKLRKKYNTKGFSKNIDNEDIVPGDYLYKSGILTKDIKKARIDEDLSFSFFKDDVIHSNKGFENKALNYNDERTINFISKSVCPTIRLESKYLSNNSLTIADFYNTNKVLSTPNVSQFYEIINSNDSQVGIIRFEHVTMDQNSKIYDRVLNPNYVDSENISFKEYDNVVTTTDEESNVVHRNYNTITIDYELNKNPNKDIYLSLSKRISSRRIVFPDFSEFNTFNGNIVYLYNNDYITNQQGIGPYDYLGNISKDYRENINTFIDDSCIAFNSFTMEYDNSIRQNDSYSSMYNSAILPIDNFGFPYSSKYKAEDRHLIPASKYITKPFVIEKIKIECLISNKSFVKSPSTNLGNSTQYTYPAPCLNFVNFFLVNQRGNLNTSSINHLVKNAYYDRNEASLSNIDKNNFDFTSSAKFTLNNRTNNNVFSTSEIFAISNEDSNYVISGSIDNIDKRNQVTSSQRDLVGFVSLANYSSGGLQESEFINTIKLKKDIDKFIDKSNDDLLDNTNISECIYENLALNIETDVKRYFKNEKMSSISRFRMYPTKSTYSRSNIDLSNNRSIPQENISDTTSLTTLTDGLGRNINVKEEYGESCKYILMPEDNLFLGISLSNSNFTQEDLSNNAQLTESEYQLLSDTISFGNDLVKISCTDDYPFKLHLLGYYLEDENKKVIVNKDIKNYNRSKKVGYTQNEIVDKVGSNLAILDQNFYDRTGYAYASTDLSSKIKVNSSKNKTKLGNFFRLPKWPFDVSISSNIFPFKAIMSNRNKPVTLTEEYYTYNFINENGSPGSSIKYIDCFYNKYRFGMFADKLNYNRIHQFTGAKYKNVKKRFMKGYFKEKAPATISGKIIFDFTKLDEFKGTNYLKEVIMTSLTNKQSASASLILNIRDNSSNDIYIQILTDSILDPASGESISNLYSVNQNVNNEEVILTEVPSEITNGFIKNQNGSYDSDLNLLKRNFVDLVANSINNINQVTQKKFPLTPAETKNFKLNVTAEVVLDSIPTDLIEIKVTLNNRGFVNNANISNYYLNSGITIQNFEVEEGDIINSYNTDVNASFNALNSKTNSFEFYDV